MFKHVLLPTDGSELSAAAIKQGIRFAKSIGAKVTGLCVMPLQHPFFYETEIPMDALEHAAKRYKELADTYLAAAEKGAREAGVACDVVYEKNDSPYAAIIRAAEQKGYDLIMMASHGRRGVRALLIGSETQKVLTHSKIPVLVYRCETVCEISDHPYETIIRAAEKRGCDLIMMASHGQKGVKGLLLGSQTQKVLTHSRIPVLVLR